MNYSQRKVCIKEKWSPFCGSVSGQVWNRRHRFKNEIKAIHRHSELWVSLMDIDFQSELVKEEDRCAVFSETIHLCLEICLRYRRTTYTHQMSRFDVSLRCLPNVDICLRWKHIVRIRCDMLHHFESLWLRNLSVLCIFCVFIPMQISYMKW